uniref:CRAL-TRIO domain-containing protein n=1 Tax=Cyclophora tenuis TaxID=216820 RepID=A0A7S1GIN1_CYCTE|mmetsp:Transcript_14519/g.24662  ORF Transcript_14519/g.24662 Transcript_14519/m.24662 type:complete len:332 (+) Transcript_14519:33-1028(+)
MVTAFPFSAPRFTEEQQAKEKASLKDEEKAQIQRDIYGKGSDMDYPEETDEFLIPKLEMFQQEVDAIDYKPAYLEALEKAPKIVEEESPAVTFLRCENYEPKPAAKRLIMYWKFRKQFFGEDKFCLPMTIHGGAMDEKDAQYVREGITLQWCGMDQHGRPVIVHEIFRPKVSHFEDKTPLYRAFFYMHQKFALSSRTAQLNGAVLITNAKTYDIRIFDRKQIKTVVEWLTDGAPCKIAADHMVSGPSLQNLFMSIVMPILLAVFSRHLRQRVLFHCGQDTENIASLEAKYGISSLAVPEGLGGEWTMDLYDDWLNRQIALEDQNNNNDNNN